MVTREHTSSPSPEQSPLSSSPDIMRKLQVAEQPFRQQMRQVFGMDLYPFTVQPVQEDVSPASIRSLLESLLEALKAQQQVYLDADQVTRAMEVDIATDQDLGVTLTQVERALEFLNDRSPRKNPETFLAVMEKILAEAEEEIEVLSPIGERIPSVVFPRGAFSVPIFGFEDRSVWRKKRAMLNKRTHERITKVRDMLKEFQTV